MPIIILEIDAWTGAAVETLRFASKTFVTAEGDQPANTSYLGRILDAGKMGSTAFGDGSLGRPTVSQGSLVLNNQDGRLDHLLNYGFDGRSFTIREIADEHSPVASGVLIAKGICAGIDATDAWKSIRVRLRDQMAALQKPLLTARYAGTSTSTGLGVEGGADLKDQIKPYIFGTAINAPLIVANGADSIYQACANGFHSAQVYDGGVPLNFAGDYPTLAALRAAALGTIATQAFGTCKALGLIKTDDRPQFGLTADIVEGAVAAQRSAAQVVRRVLTLAGIPDAMLHLPSFAALDALNPAEVGVYLTGEDDIASVVGQVLDSVGAALIPDDNGILHCIAFRPPSGPPAAIYTLRDLKGEGTLRLVSGVSEEGDGVPAYSVALDWGRVWQVMAEGDLDRSGITVERRAFLTSATRTASAKNDAVRIAHPLAAEIKAATLLVHRADAEAEAARRLAMHSVRRDRLSITVPRARAVPRGAVVMLQIPRFGFQTGKLFRVIGRTNDHTKREVTLELWG